MKYTKKQYIQPKVRLIETDAGDSLLDGSQEVLVDKEPITDENDVW